MSTRKKVAINFDRDKEGIKYKFPSRTCKECFLYPCFRGMETFSCDMAKYGCRDYKGKYDKDRLCQTSSF